MSITVKNVSKYYGNQKAISKISFSLKKGEIVGFLGPNGAGKSTLMKIICCYLSQDFGNIKVCNLDTKNEKLMVKSKIGYLSETNPLYLEMYIKEYLYFIASIHKIENMYCGCRKYSNLEIQWSVWIMFKILTDN